MFICPSLSFLNVFVHSGIGLKFIFGAVFSDVVVINDMGLIIFLDVV